MKTAGAISQWLPLLCAPLAWAASSNEGVTPIQKVLTMLGGMLEKSKADKQAEAVEWAAFKEFCTNTELVKQKAIQKADTQKEALKADIEARDQEVKRLTKEIAGHGTDIKGYKGDQAKATKDRQADRATYQKTHEDYSESIDALSNAISVLKKQAADIPQAAALIQATKSYKQWPASSRKAIETFLSLGEESQNAEQQAAPEANAYEFQSGGIVALLTELKDKFVDERTALEKKEMIAQQAYDTVMMDLRNSIKTAESETDKKTKSKSDNIAGSTESSALFDQTKDSRDEDQKYLTGLITTCQEKASDFKARQTLRQEETVAIEKAIEIISGDAVSGSAAKHLPKLIQASQGVSFTQFLSTAKVPNQQKAVDFLYEASRRLDSHVLSALAMQAEADPFKKVKKMISDLITKLKAQESEEADHHTWCTSELKTNAKTRKDKTDEVDTLKSQIDQLESRLAVLKKDLAELAQGIADISSAVAKATENRAKEKDINEATIVEAVNGQTSIAKAKQILSDFYKKAGANTALVQQDAKQPQGYNSAFKGQQKQGANVLSFLEVISSDFARLEEDTKKAESTAQTEHDDFMAESKKSTDAKEAEQKTKKKEQVDKNGELANKNDDLESSQKQLDAALVYHDKLKPSCVNQAQPYEERVQRREGEIASLKEALEILNGEGVPSGPDALYSSTQGGNLAVDSGR